MLHRKWRLEKTDEVVDFEEMFLGDDGGKEGDKVAFAKDNRDIVDQNSSQKLSRSGIIQ